MKATAILLTLILTACGATPPDLTTATSAPRELPSETTDGPHARADAAGARAVARESYRFAGASTLTGAYHGVHAELTVVNPTLPAGTAFVAGWVMAAVPGTGQHFGQVGWAETSWSRPDVRQVFTYNTLTKKWQFYRQFALRDGQALRVANIAVPGHFYSYVLWEGTWRLIHDQPLPAGPVPLLQAHQQVESYSTVGTWARFDPVAITRGAVLTPAGEWLDWTRAVATTVNQAAPLCLGWSQEYTHGSIQECQ